MDDGVSPPPDGAHEQVCETGGQVTVSGLMLAIPPGALDHCEEIGIEVLGSPPSGYHGYSSVYSFTPAGLALMRPATVSFTVPGDPAYPVLFWHAPPSTGFQRTIGVTIETGIVAAAIDILGEGFVGNGVDYVDPPDPSCSVARTLEGRVNGNAALPAGGSRELSSSISLFFTVEDCAGRPIPGLQANDFAIREDGAALSVEAEATILPNDGLQVYVELMLDLSNSTVPLRPQLIASAKAFVTKLQLEDGASVPVGVTIFAGGSPTSWQLPTRDTAVILARLDALLTAQPDDPASTNLYGSLVDTLSLLGYLESDYRARSLGGAFTAGHVVVFTDGRDTAGIAAESAVQTAAARQPGDQIWIVGLHSPDFDSAALHRIASSDYTVLESSTPADLTINFVTLAIRIARQSTQTYYLGYCSPKRSGMHQVSAQLGSSSDPMSKPASYQFSANGFTSTCSAAVLTGRCSGRECGGLACGGCDERTDGCDRTDYQCKSYCDLQSVCGGDTIVNPAGYEQSCPDSMTREQCDGTCVDPATYQTDVRNCGGCGNVCSSPFATMVSCNSTCSATCIPGYADCDQTSATGCETEIFGADRANCGACGSACVGTCSSGVCSPLIATGVGSVTALDVDSTHVYWSGGGGTRRAPKGGGAVLQVAGNGGAFVLDGSYLYWRDPGVPNGNIYPPERILRVPRAGGAQEGVAYSTATNGSPTLWTVIMPAFTVSGNTAYFQALEFTKSPGVQSPGRVNLRSAPIPDGVKTDLTGQQTDGPIFDKLAGDAANLYWKQSDGIYRVAKTGGATIQIATASGPEALIVNGSIVYFWAGGQWLRTSTTGGAPVVVTSMTTLPSAFAADDTALYWVENDGVIKRVVVATGQVSQYHTAALDAHHVNRLAVDGAYVYWAGDAGTATDIGIVMK